MTPAAARSLLRVQHLAVAFGTTDKPLVAVDDASFEVRAGETVCLVGESGSGKTVTALSILRLEGQRNGRILAGDVHFDGRSLIDIDARSLDRLRGGRIGMIFQEPMTAFDPVFSVGDQIIETILRHERVSRRAARERTLSLLERVHIPDAALRMRQIPQQLSGGLRQRAMIAMALACGPELLIADEPTTALDVTVQAQILALLKELQQTDKLAILFITHDLGVAAEMADRVVVMYAGRIAEQAPVHGLFSRPAHPYTRGLLRSAVPLDGPRARQLTAIAGSIPRLTELPSGCRFHPRCAYATDRCREHAPALTAWHDINHAHRATHAQNGVATVAKTSAREVACFYPLADTLSDPPLTAAEVRSNPLTEQSAAARTPLIEAQNLTKHYALHSGLWGPRDRVRALDGVSFAIEKGETLGLVGESGCGKSTLGRVLLSLEPATRGHVLFQGQAVDGLHGSARKRVQREMQMIFQDPYGSIDPRWRAGDIIAEPLRAHERASRQHIEQRVEELLELVGLPKSARTRYAHEFSGGQRQRIGIARAIALRPQFIVADEAVSALDLSVQAQIINLLVGLRERLGLTTLFIGHGLHVVRHVSDRIGVMYLGRLVELAPADALFDQPLHHYTRALLAAIPAADPNERGAALSIGRGELPSQTRPPSGCHYHPRCPAATERCRTEAPALHPQSLLRQVACHYPLN